MAWKFLNIGKANARIDELESQLAAVTKERDDALKASGENSTEIQAEHERVSKQAEDASAKCKQLESDLTTAKTSIASSQTKIAELESKLAAKDSEVKIQVARQAQEIQAQLGQPPKPEPPKAGTVQPGAETGMSRVLASAKADLDRAGYVRKN